MAGRPKDIWVALVNRVCLTLLPGVGIRIQIRLELPKFPGRTVNLNLTAEEARKWADSLNYFAQKVEDEYTTGKH